MMGPDRSGEEVQVSEGSGFQIQGRAPERYERHVAPIMAPFVTAILDATAPRPGEAVLDVACGTGFVARAAAERVAPGGSVDGVDLNPAMLAIAAERAPAIRWHHAPGDALPFDDASFDVILCQQGLQFFPDRAAAAREFARVARPGARIAITVWSPVERNPLLAAQLHAIETLAPAPVRASFLQATSCDPADVASAFTAAELHDVTATEVRVDITLHDVDTFVPEQLAALPWATALVAAQEDGLHLAASSVLAELGDAITDDRSMTLPFASALVVGRR
jgi:SAM-dependent methyltransferase